MTSARDEYVTNRVRGTAYAAVEHSQVSCIITRFRLRHVWSIIPVFWGYRRIHRAAVHVDGLIASMFLFENSRTCYTVSLWRDDTAVLRFNSIVQSHAQIANSLFRHFYSPKHRRCELWSAQFRLSAVGANLNWTGVDLGIKQASLLDRLSTRT